MGASAFLEGDLVGGRPGGGKATAQGQLEKGSGGRLEGLDKRAPENLNRPLKLWIASRWDVGVAGLESRKT